ncbi:DUF2851 family protein [Abyssalbus ytuae]|uniref:DUF2851 family protein n=1 Tax=Abyssalbus ytuae TaxID=2926907 RepID=A0A9E6ZS50_9FLAO|nr:DUF2851 family protein [Abyssalbus ytuae]UOB16858.1 DUF2851 family protein [Abyssalbus ytuae]
MNEDFLHYLWKFKKFDFVNLKTTNGDKLEILSVGVTNNNSGPDFFNARLKVGGQQWAGNVEIHLKSSDWYLHNHENDAAYKNVILHVVWEHDVDVFIKNNTSLPTLELKERVQTSILDNYYSLISAKKNFINCENQVQEIDSFVFQNWLQRLYFERLEDKSKLILEELKNTNNDWEALLFVMLAKSFGLKVNGDSFYSIAKSVDYSVIRKVQNDIKQTEALLFGQGGLLGIDCLDTYYIELKKEYEYLKNKFQLETRGVIPVKLSKLRPPNFPTLRLSQMASLLYNRQNLFSKVINAVNIQELYEIFKVKASNYWDSHFTFGKISSKSKKVLTQKFIDLIIINTIIPVKFCYGRSIGKETDEEIITLIQSLTKESNSIINGFHTIKLNLQSAMDTQSALQLYNNYCTKNKCLQCAVGISLIKY